MAGTAILGISAYYHDSAAALLVDGKIIAAAQEERFTRIKGDSSFPHNAIAMCLDKAGICERDLDHVVFYENPFAKYDRLMTTYHVTAPSSLKSFLRSMPSWITRKLWMSDEISSELGSEHDIHFCDHHLSHAASAFFPSPYEEAAILTIDGVGEWSTSTWGVGKGRTIKLEKETRFPNSIGLLYSAFTQYAGFKVNSGEYKLMGLAPYGKPIYADLIKDKLVKINADGTVILNQVYFDYIGGLTMTNRKFHELFGAAPRIPDTELSEKEMNIAASIQYVLNEIVLRMAEHIQRCTGLDNLVMAGGVALNVVSNGYLSRFGPFSRIWVQPAAGDSGGALGAALWFWHQILAGKRPLEPDDSMSCSYLGLEIKSKSRSDDLILERLGASWISLSEEELIASVAESIAAGKIVAIARDRAEFGPRALGNRSIIADARSTEMQSHLNLSVKFRESFRPFAPMVLLEDAEQYFEIKQESPYMLFCYPVLESRRTPPENEEGLSGIALLKQKRSQIPAVTHVDYSARVQTVDRARNPFMHAVLSRFKEITSCPVIVNTSFNVRGEPIVNTVEDAYRCFMATNIDCLVIGDRFIAKDKQSAIPLTEQERQLWLRRFELD